MSSEQMRKFYNRGITVVGGILTGEAIFLGSKVVESGGVAKMFESGQVSLPQWVAVGVFAGIALWGSSALGASIPPRVRGSR